LTSYTAKRGFFLEPEIKGKIKSSAANVALPAAFQLS
jgi:hypothetical protein